MNGILTILWVSVMLHGTASTTFADYTTVLYASLSVGPVFALFSTLFTRAAHRMEAAEREAAFLDSYHIDLKENRVHTESTRLRTLAWFLVVLYTVSCVYLTLFFTFQHDSTSQSDPKASVLPSLQWLRSCIFAFLQMCFINVPVFVALRTVACVYLGRHRLNEFIVSAQKQHAKIGTNVCATEAGFSQEMPSRQSQACGWRGEFMDACASGMCMHD